MASLRGAAQVSRLCGLQSPGKSLPLYATAVANLALADVVSNIHSFIIIATNHCGDDM